MKMKLVYLSFFILSQVVTAQKKIGDDCGTWRWDIKTATDADGSGILSKTAVKTTIDELTSLPRPDKVGKQDPRYPEEKRLVKVRGFIIEHKIVGGKGDTDYHIVVQSSTKKSQLIVEIPNPECGVFTNEPDLKEIFTEARDNYNEYIGTPTQKLTELPEPIEVEVTGIPLWDMPDHGGGCSENGIEIHPVIGIKRISAKKTEKMVAFTGFSDNSPNDNNMKANISGSPTDVLAIILLGIIMGMVGQGLRVIVGLKKVNDEANKAEKTFNEVFEMKKLLFSLMYAFAIGAVGGVILSIDYIGKPIDKSVILAMIAASYAGTDFIEGFVNKTLKK